MIISEKRLKRIISETLLSEDFLPGGLSRQVKDDDGQGYELDDVISDFENDFNDAAVNADSKRAIIAVRKNNTLLDIILHLLEHKPTEFANFYKNSKFKADADFMAIQTRKLKRDHEKMSLLLESFLKGLRASKDEAAFKTHLNKLQRDLNNYTPQWYPLQWIFYNINSPNFLNVLEEFAQNDDNFQTFDQQKILQIPKVNNIKRIITAVITAINKSRLSDEDKREILGDMVREGLRTSQRSNGSDLGWFGDIIDNAYEFLMTNQSGSRSQFALKNTKFSSELGNLFGDVWNDKNLLNQGGSVGQLITSVFDKLKGEDFEGAAEEIFKSPIVKKFLDDLLNGDGNISDADFNKAVDEIFKFAKEQQQKQQKNQE